MARSIKELEHELMALPSQDRARLAHDLIISLDNGKDEDLEAYWDKEIRQRLSQIDEGTASLSTATNVFTKARDAIKK